MIRTCLFAAACALFAGAGQAQNQFQTADPQVVNALNEIVFLLGQGCNSGNANACALIPMVQQEGQTMLQAGHACQFNGNQQACAFYQQELFNLQQGYQQVQYAAQSGLLYQPTGGGGQVPGMGQTHEQRMQQIHNWGQQRLEWGNQQQQLMDQRHQQFMEMLRN